MGVFVKDAFKKTCLLILVFSFCASIFSCAFFETAPVSSLPGSFPGSTVETEGETILPTDPLQPDTIVPTGPLTTVPTEPTEPTEPFTEPQPTLPNTENVYINPLSGLPISEELYGKRPIAVQINNLKKALPQVGIKEADIFYECPVEGGLTRLLAIYSDYKDIPLIGSVRSARECFVTISLIYNSIYVHAGGSGKAYDMISELNVDNLDGVNMYLPTVFWRDENRVQVNGSVHALVTSGSGILDGIKKRKIQEDGEISAAFNFSDERIVRNEKNCKKITVPYYSVISEYLYNEADDKYYRSEYSMPQMDGETQLSFDNVLILFTKQKVYDSEGRLDIDLQSGGSAYYVSGGAIEEITWQRNKNENFRFYNAENEELKVNTGKTIISVMPDYIKKDIIIEK